MSEPPRPDTFGTPTGGGTPPIPPPPRRSRRGAWVGLVGAIVAIVLVGGTIVWAMISGNEGSPSGEPVTPASLLASASGEAQAADCGDVVDVGPYLPADQDAAHVDPLEMPPLSSWPSVPPTSGPHAPETLPAGHYETSPPMLPLIHSLEHGAVVVWYSPGTSGDEVARIVTFYQNPEIGGHVIVAPYDYPDEGEAGRLPDGVNMALVAWHHERLCAQANLAAAFGFSADYATPTFRGRPYLGEAPEPGVGI